MTAAFVILPKFINTIIFVRLNSDYLNTNEIGTELFAKCTNQIILYCQNRIDVDEAFDTKPHNGIKRANEAIDFCLYYQVIFERIMADRPAGFIVNQMAIFNYLNMFVQRLYDFIEICQGIIVFEHKNEVETFPSPFFGGIHGVEFESCCANAKVTFTRGLERIRGAETSFLDVHNYENGWPEQIKLYYTMVDNLEETIENLMKIVFADVGNVEEGIYALAGLFYYSMRPKLRAPYVKRAVQVWQMFEQEITNTNQMLLDQLNTRNSQVPRCAGRAFDLVTNSNRIARLKQLFEAAEWLPDYAYADRVSDVISLSSQITLNLTPSFHTLRPPVGLPSPIKNGSEHGRMGEKTVRKMVGSQSHRCHFQIESHADGPQRHTSGIVGVQHFR